jgi:hypothetical protein
MVKPGPSSRHSRPVFWSIKGVAYRISTFWPCKFLFLLQFIKKEAKIMDVHVLSTPLLNETGANWQIDKLTIDISFFSLSFFLVLGFASQAAPIFSPVSTSRPSCALCFPNIDPAEITPGWSCQAVKHTISDTMTLTIKLMIFFYIILFAPWWFISYIAPTFTIYG